MGHVYLPGDEWDTGQFPSALAIGDSWIHYPVNNLMSAVVNHPLIFNDHDKVQVVGKNGALLQEFVGAGTHAAQLRHFLAPGFGSWSEFYISAAGNDAVDYKLCLRDNCGAARLPEDCFDESGLRSFLGTISTALVALIHQIRLCYQSAPIFLNGYAYPVPDGRGFLNFGPWLKPAMDRSRVPQDLHFRIGLAKILIDQLNDEVLAVAAAKDGRVVCIKSRDALSDFTPGYTDDWANELHPTMGGFDRIADQCWIDTLAEFGIAQKRPPRTAAQATRPMNTAAG